MQEAHNGTTEHPGKFEGVTVLKDPTRFDSMAHQMSYNNPTPRWTIQRCYYNNESAALVRARLSRFIAYNPNAQRGDVPAELLVVAANTPHFEESAIWVLSKQTGEPHKSTDIAFKGEGQRLGGSGPGRSDVKEKDGAKAHGKKRARDGEASTSAQGDNERTPIRLD